ncbi:MAG: succinate dehydrogenase, cytochrome b556 subunit [Halioglobus sp.]
MKDNRPVNLDIGSMRLPITAWTSISHRITGVILFFGTALLLWALDSSLRSPQGYAAVQECLASPLAKLGLWGLAAAAIYHSLAGVRHIIMDFGIGESMEGGVLGARLVIGLTAIITLIAGAWIW